MASHQLAIAKASFSAGLLRPDPTSLSRDDIAHFHSLLNSVILQCSPKNVQICKQWILENIVQSAARFTALGKYLTSLTAAFTEGGRKDVAIREPSVKRKRLHVLYLVNDILHHSRHRSNDASICGKVQPILVSLFGSVSSFKDCPKHQGKVSDLLDIWEEKSYYSKDYIDKLREAVKNASDAGEHVDGSSDRKEEGLPVKNAKSAPYVMPAMHGDASTPWFDLPAGNLMPHIVPNSTRPINPDMIKPLQFVAGPAEEGLTQAVKALLEDVQAIYGENNDQEEKASLDIDELGQVIVVDEITGDIIEGEGYYGWSRTFCEKMKRRKKGIDVPSRAGARDQRSQSRSSSPGMRKRRYSQSSDSSDMGGSRAARRRRSYSSSRSPSPDGKRNAHARPRSRSITFSPSPPPPPPSSEPRNTSGPNSFQGPPPPPPNNFGPRPPMPPMSQPPFQQGFNPNFPIPPPPPHQMPWNGQQQQYPAWIPPPPQPMQNMSFNAQAQLHNPHQHFNPQNQQYPQNQQQYGSWPPPPPPPGPPPPNYQQQGQYPPGPGSGQQQQGNGRGYNNTPPNNNGWNNAPRGGRGW